MFALMKPGAAATVTGLLVLATTGADTVDQPQVAQAAQEVHLRNIRQLTFEGENAEAYFSFDGTRLIFQSTPGRRVRPNLHHVTRRGRRRDVEHRSGANHLLVLLPSG